ncbi:MAG: hypothetical protein ACRDD2_04755 [Sarcina sp.]
MKKRKQILATMSILIALSIFLIPKCAEAMTKAHATYISSVRITMSSLSGTSIVQSVHEKMSAPVSSEIKVGNTTMQYKKSTSYMGLYPAETYIVSSGMGGSVINGVNVGGWEYYRKNATLSF